MDGLLVCVYIYACMALELGACRWAYIVAQIMDRMQFNLLACCDRNKEKKQPGR
jgi:hypothetical protein